MMAIYHERQNMSAMTVHDGIVPSHTAMNFFNHTGEMRHHKRKWAIYVGDKVKIYDHAAPDNQSLSLMKDYRNDMTPKTPSRLLQHAFWSRRTAQRQGLMINRIHLTTI